MFYYSMGLWFVKEHIGANDVSFASCQGAWRWPMLRGLWQSRREREFVKRTALPSELTLVVLVGIGWPGRSATVRVRAASQPSYSAIFANTSDHVYRSIDGGVTWQESDHGLPGGGIFPIIAGAAATLYSAPGSNGVYRSDDGGASWQDDNSAYGVGPGSVALYGLAVDPGDGRLVYALDSYGSLFRSADAAIIGPGQRPRSRRLATALLMRCSWTPCDLLHF